MKSRMNPYKVHTGNLPHPDSSEAQRYLARRWGKAHGYAGAVGGWIHKIVQEPDPELGDGFTRRVLGAHVAHGWAQLYRMKVDWILEWACRQAPDGTHINPECLAAALKGKQVQP